MDTAEYIERRLARRIATAQKRPSELAISTDEWIVLREHTACLSRVGDSKDVYRSARKPEDIGFRFRSIPVVVS